MSIATEITRLTGLRNDIRDKLVTLGLSSTTDKLENLKDDIVGISNFNNNVTSGSTTNKYSQRGVGVSATSVGVSAITTDTGTTNVEVTPSTADQFINISKGLHSAKYVKVKPMSGGSYVATVASHTVSSGSATSSVGGTVTNISTATKPSGTDGTDYYTITPSLSTSAGSSSTTAKAEIDVAGYLAAGSKTATSNNKSVGVTKNQGSNRYITLSIPSSNGTTNPSTTSDPYTNVHTFSRNNAAQYVKIPKGYNNTNRMFTISAVDNANPMFDGGALSIASSSTAASGSNVTISEVTSSNATNGIEINTSGKAKAKRADVLYNGDVDGYVVRANDTVALASATMSTDATLSTKKYKITALNVPKDVPFTITTTADTALDTTSTIAITNNAYRKTSVSNNVNGTVEVTGGNVKVSAKLASDDTNDTQKTIATNGVFNIANPTFSGGELSVTGTGATASFTNITTSTTDNGIKVLAKGSAKAKRENVVYNTNVDGYVVKSSGTNALSGTTMSSASTWNGTSYYITGVTVPKTKNFTVTNEANDANVTTGTLTVYNNARRTVNITNDSTATTNITNGNINTNGGYVKVSAKINSTDTNNTTQYVTTNAGLWKTNTISAANTWYYGATKASAGSFGTETTTDPGSSVTNHKTIAPGTSAKYIPISAGYIGAGKVTVSAMPSGSVSVSNGNITISQGTATLSNNVVSIPISGSVTVNPSVTAGYVTSGTGGTISVPANTKVTYTIPVNNPTSSVTPSTTSQTITGTYMTSVVVNAVTGLADSNAAAADIFSGKIAVVKNSSNTASKVTGSMANYRDDVTSGSTTTKYSQQGVSVSTSSSGVSAIKSDNSNLEVGASASSDQYVNISAGAHRSKYVKVKKATSITVPKDVAFSVTTSSDTAYDTTSNLTITNGQFRNVSVTNDSTGSKNGVTTVTGGTAKITVGTDTQTVMENGTWKAYTHNRSTDSQTSYGKVTTPGVADGSVGTVTTTNPNVTNRRSVTPSTSTQYVKISAGYQADGQITINAIPSTTVTINASDWPSSASSGWYSVTKDNLPGDIATGHVVVIPNSNDYKTIAQSCGVYASAQAASSTSGKAKLTFKAAVKPTSAIQYKIYYFS